MMNHDTLEDKDTGEDRLDLHNHLQNQNQGMDHILSIIKFVSYTIYYIKKITRYVGIQLVHKI